MRFFKLSDDGKDKRFFWACTALIALASVLRLCFWAATDLNIMEADGLARLKLVSIIPYLFELRELPGGLTWPSLHFFSISFFHHLLGLPLVFSGRLVSFLAGASAVGVFFLFTESFFGFSAAVFAAFILALNAEMVVFSSLPMSEMPFIFCALVTMRLVWQFHITKNEKYLKLSILACTASSLIRYEGWILAGLCCVFVLAHFRASRRAAAYVALFAAQTIAYVVIQRLLKGEWVMGPHNLAFSPQEYYNTESGRRWTIPLIYLEITRMAPDWLKLLIMLGVAFAIPKRRHLLYLLFCLIFFAFPTYLLWKKTALPTARYYYFAFTVAIPFAGLALQRITKWNPILLGGIAMLAILGTSIVDIAESYSHVYRSFFQYTQGNIETAKWIKEHSAPEDIVLLDPEERSRGEGWFLLAEKNGHYVYVLNGGFDPSLNLHDGFNQSMMRAFLTHPKLRYFVIYEKNHVEPILQLPEFKKIIEEQHLRFSTVFQQYGYKIWRVDR